MKLQNMLFAIAMIAAVISCFISLNFGLIAIVVVILTDLFCDALINRYKDGCIRLGVLTAIAWILLIIA